MNITTVLFDIGNVLSHDGHETYLTHEVYGLARELDMPADEIKQRVNPIFRKYAVGMGGPEEDFWQEVGNELGLRLTPEMVSKVKTDLESTNTEAVKAFEELKKHGINIGIISNSTSLFYEMQTEPLQLDKYARPDLLFLSHIHGKLKSGGLFEIAAEHLVPSETVIIEDRPKNVEYARSLGFKVMEYSFKSGESLLAIVKQMIKDQ